ncbi:MAG: ATPase, T2SS/T4P/T4SS family [Planctomycetota bacterium]
MVRVSGKIRHLLIDAGLVSAEDWASARETGQPVVDVLLERRLVEERRLYELLAETSGLPPVDLSRVRPDPAAHEALPPEICVEHCVFPIAKNGDNLTVAVSDPFDVLLFDDLKILSRCRVRPVLSHPSAIKAALNAVHDGNRQDVEDLLTEVEGQEIVVERQDELEDIDVTIASGAEDVPAVKLVNLILFKALREKASDIHIEPLDHAIRVRYRVDGHLFEVMSPPKHILPSLMTRLKILANLDIAVRMEPQDGKFQIKYEGRTIDFRLSTLPVVGGEKAVMRILDQSGIVLRLDALGFEPKCLEDFRAGAEAAYGMLLITGPTGSGKSTTLYAAVREVSSPEINVVTVEDPVEYRMDGINQVPVNPKRGLTFATALRSILRQDPDVVLVGEIRDKETAEIAVKAALTGHLVLSTLHTNDAVGAVTRLVDMGVDPFMVASSVIVVAAQRLVRRLCPHCKKQIEVPERELRAVGFTDKEIAGLQIFGPEAQGCPRCKGGYRGRLAILETLRLTAKVKRMVVEGRSVQEIKAEGLQNGMLTLRRVGLMNVMRGNTSLEEVLRVTMAD